VGLWGFHISLVVMMWIVWVGPSICGPILLCHMSMWQVWWGPFELYRINYAWWIGWNICTSGKYLIYCYWSFRQTRNYFVGPCVLVNGRRPHVSRVARHGPSMFLMWTLYL